MKLLDGGRHARAGRQDRSRRLRHADGAVPDERPRRRRHRLAPRPDPHREHPRRPRRRRPLGAEEAGRLLRLRREAAPPRPSPRVAEIIEDFRKKSGSTVRAISDEEIVERTLYPMVNEGALILEEGKAQRRERRRCRLDLRLWLAGLSRRPDVLGEGRGVRQGREGAGEARLHRRQEPEGRQYQVIGMPPVIPAKAGTHGCPDRGPPLRSPAAGVGRRPRRGDGA